MDDEMLSKRNRHILTSLINEYILTAEPVGSRKIAKKYNINLSSATIRNVMSDLEELGFLHQPGDSICQHADIRGLTGNVGPSGQ